ncbi:MAG: flagellar biosynthetic protein FliQ [Candidatus Schekmanbacteria bacterium RBG_13_48_7]|uniref:Flagellar biosynthetic protein FliQ n=1 Tax=Candidatus Schekmanbacteria bacterium RBG_13_48_7 TaxID=1817878 RepID=A0A1F7RS75_9BACT|nr:MAG: flagellar biosynthetic protein FliQ [Candidatus Schekmanbacteria bacterium RBG_13_48_7]
MTPEMVTDLGFQTFKAAIMLAGPMLAGGLIIGIGVSIFQAVTSIQDMTLTFVPKIIVVMLILLFCFPWMLNIMESFSREIFLKFPLMAQ